MFAVESVVAVMAAAMVVLTAAVVKMEFLDFESGHQSSKIIAGTTANLVA